MRVYVTEKALLDRDTYRKQHDRVHVKWFPSISHCSSNCRESLRRLLYQYQCRMRGDFSLLFHRDRLRLKSSLLADQCLRRILWQVLLRLFFYNKSQDQGRILTGFPEKMGRGSARALIQIPLLYISRQGSDPVGILILRKVRL